MKIEEQAMDWHHYYLHLHQPNPLTDCDFMHRIVCPTPTPTPLMQVAQHKHTASSSPRILLITIFHVLQPNLTSKSRIFEK